MSNIILKISIFVISLSAIFFKQIIFNDILSIKKIKYMHTHTCKYAHSFFHVILLSLTKYKKYITVSYILNTPI